MMFQYSFGCFLQFYVGNNESLSVDRINKKNDIIQKVISSLSGEKNHRTK